MTTGVRLEVSGGVAVVTLGSTFSPATGRALGEAYRTCDDEDAVRAVVLTGAGTVFCTGASMDAGFSSATEDFSASPVQPPAWRVRKPVIAAVNGHAIGIGFTLALQCDLRIVAEDAKLAVPQVRRGVIGDAAGHWTLRRIAGTAIAAELLLTGRTLSGWQAADRGLANRAVPAAEVLPAALEVARDIAVNVAPAAAALSKAILWSDLPPDAVAAAETEAHRFLLAHPDAAEGPRAYVEKRSPHWTSKSSEPPPPFPH